jgi:hypothetical protein
MSFPNDSSICPVCFTLYPIAAARSQNPTCPDCGSEAIEVDLEPLTTFLERHCEAELREKLSKWNAATGFYESYKEAKRKRIEVAIAAKTATAKP